jgi:hypothetical protein
MSEKVFISYSRDDSEFALRLATDLRRARVDLWVDQLDIRTGDTWDRAVEAALQECTGLLVVLSPDAVDSRSVMDEVSYALEENKRVFPVIYRACKIPFRLRRVQHTDLTADYDRRLAGLIRDLGGTPPALQAESPAAEWPSARTDARADPVSDPASTVSLAAAADDPRAAEVLSAMHALPLAGEQAAAEAGDPRGAGEAPAGFGHPMPGTTSRPALRAPVWAVRHRRRGTALALGTGGALLQLAALVPRLASGDGADGYVLLYALITGLWCAAAGAIAGPRRGPLRWTLAIGLGTYVLGLVFVTASLLFPWGALLGALIGVAMLRLRGGPVAEPAVGGSRRIHGGRP